MLLGVDYGTAKIGLAVSEQSSKAIPLALSIVRYKNFKELEEKLNEVIRDYNIEAFVVGDLPEDKAGDEEKKKHFESFKTFLATFSIPISYIDEQRSTQAAKSLGKDDPNFKTKNDDALAAQFILESYLGSDGSIKD